MGPEWIRNWNVTAMAEHFGLLLGEFDLGGMAKLVRCATVEPHRTINPHVRQDGKGKSLYDGRCVHALQDTLSLNYKCASSGRDARKLQPKQSG